MLIIVLSFLCIYNSRAHMFTEYKLLALQVIYYRQINALTINNHAQFNKYEMMRKDIILRDTMINTLNLMKWTYKDYFPDVPI
jgi:hypothetical protein